MKISFKLEMSIINSFIKYIKANGTESNKQSKYQKLMLTINGTNLIVYPSGIIIFDDNEYVSSLISKFFAENGIENEDFNSYLLSKTEMSRKYLSGWTTTPKGVWLTESQLNTFLMLIRAIPEIIEKDSNKYQKVKFLKNQQELIINKNRIVYTIGGFEGLQSILKKAIDSNNDYSKYDKVIAIDEQGRWGKIGPLCVSVVSLSPNQIIEFQMKGVKDNSLSRSLDFEDFETILRNHSDVIFILNPEEINKNCSNKSEYNNYLASRYRDFFTQMEVKKYLTGSTLLVVDKYLFDVDVLPHYDNTIIVDRKQRNSISLGIGSIVSQLGIEKWKSQIYEKYGIKANRQNFEELRFHLNKEEFVKLFLI